MSLNNKELDKVDATLSSLRLTPPYFTKRPTSSSSKKLTDEDSAPDSWEEAASDDEEVPAPTSKHIRVDSTNVPNPPPPTPISPPNGNPFAPPPPQQSSIADRFGTGFSATTERQRPTPASRDSDQRQEKTDAVAKRLIAGALGIKAPKKTDEQRAYDRAIREKEMKRRNEDKEREKQKMEEAERAKAAVWED